MRQAGSQAHLKQVADYAHHVESVFVSLDNLRALRQSSQSILKSQLSQTLKDEKKQVEIGVSSKQCLPAKVKKELTLSKINNPLQLSILKKQQLPSSQLHNVQTDEDTYVICDQEGPDLASEKVVQYQ